MSKVFTCTQGTARFTTERDTPGKGHVSVGNRRLDLTLPPTIDLAGVRWVSSARVGNSRGLDETRACWDPDSHPYMKDLAAKARLAAYRAMAACGSPCPTYEQWQEAGRHHIDLPQAPPMLTPWTPQLATRHITAAAKDREHLEPETQACLCPPDVISKPLQQSLLRALRLAGGIPRVYEPLEEAGGYAWYQRLPVVQSLDPDAQAMTLTLHFAGGGQAPLTLATDLLLPADGFKPWRRPEQQTLRIRTDAGLSPETVADALVDGYFDTLTRDPGEWSTQLLLFQDQALYTAAWLLQGEDRAAAQAIARIAARELGPYLPEDRTLDLSIKPGTAPAVTLHKN